MPPQTLSVVTLIASSTVVSAIVSVGVVQWSAWRQRRRAEVYTALRVALTLEDYSGEAATNLQKARHFDVDVGDEEFNQSPAFPDFPAYPDDLDWKELPAHLASACLSFPREVRFAQEIIRSAWGFDKDAGLESMTFHLEARGKRAADLADRLRHRYGLPLATDADLASDEPGAGPPPWAEHSVTAAALTRRSELPEPAGTVRQSVAE